MGKTDHAALQAGWSTWLKSGTEMETVNI